MPQPQRQSRAHRVRFLFGRRRSRIRDEALAWLARLKRGLRHGEGAEFLAWLKRRSHRIAIAKAAVEWHGPEVLAVLSQIFPIPPAILEPRRGRRPALLTVAAFAGACITLGVPLALLLTARVHRDEYTTAIAATRQVTLEDGTRVALNRGTQIDVTYATQARSVFVARGEALFKVARAPNRAFYVHAVGQNFEASSATFDVRLAPSGMLIITVLDGTVTVLSSPLKRCNGHVSNSKVWQQILLEPLQMLAVEPDGQMCQTLTLRDLRSQLSWQKGT